MRAFTQVTDSSSQRQRPWHVVGAEHHCPQDSVLTLTTRLHCRCTGCAAAHAARVVRRSRARRNQGTDGPSPRAMELEQAHAQQQAEVQTLEPTAPQRPDWVLNKGPTLSGVVMPFESVKVGVCTQPRLGVEILRLPGHGTGWAELAWTSWVAAQSVSVATMRTQLSPTCTLVAPSARQRGIAGYKHPHMPFWHVPLPCAVCLCRAVGRPPPRRCCRSTQP